MADIFRSCERDFLAQHPTSPQQRKALRDIGVCRTAALGGHLWRCEQCDHQEISYNSCRNRHCPKCPGKSRAQWLEARAHDLLPTVYFHVVFTLPDRLGPLVLQNQQALYGVLFQTVSQTLLRIARDPRHLGAKIGFLAVLHSWGQNLMFHPHVHGVVPGGGLSPDESRWIACRSNFLLSVRVLSRLFRHRFLRSLDPLYRRGELALHGRLQPCAHPSDWKSLLQELRQTEWVVYSKRPFGGPHQVLKYLARYTHWVAISNRRLLSFEQGRLSFRYKDDRRGGLPRTMTLEGVEFIRRFLLHVLPKNFMRIRSYGFLANSCRRRKLALCRKLLAHSPTDTQPVLLGNPSASESPSRLYPACGRGPLLVIEILQPLFPAIEERMNSP